MRAVLTKALIWAVVLLAWAGVVLGAGFERRDVTFPSQGLRCAAWHYVPAGLNPGERRPAMTQVPASSLANPFMK